MTSYILVIKIYDALFFFPKIYDPPPHSEENDRLLKQKNHEQNKPGLSRDQQDVGHNVKQFMALGNKSFYLIFKQLKIMAGGVRVHGCRNEWLPKKASRSSA